MSETNTVSPLRQRMIEDMAARKLNPNTQRGHIYSCKRFAAWLKRSPDTATADEVRRFQLYLIETTSICNRNRIMTGVRFLFRVTLRRRDLAAEVWHLKEPERLPPVLSPEEVKRVLTMATSLKARAMLTLAYGCGLRAGGVFSPKRLWSLRRDRQRLEMDQRLVQIRTLERDGNRPERTRTGQPAPDAGTNPEPRHQGRLISVLHELLFSLSTCRKTAPGKRSGRRASGFSYRAQQAKSLTAGGQTDDAGSFPLAGCPATKGKATCAKCLASSSR
jgi:integrase